MHVQSALLSTYVFASLSAAFELPFGLQFPWVYASDAHQAPLAILPHLTADEEVETNDHLNRIAIIGAGAGGSSAAFWIGKAKERWGLDLEVDVFDSKSYIGGRSITVQPYDDPRLEPIELGASIFVEANKILWRSSDEFGFNRTDFEESDETIGVWDGSQFLITTSSGRLGGWWTTIKILWRYGIQAPRRAQALMQDMLKQFITLYTPARGAEPFTNLPGLVSALGWSDMVGNTTLDYFNAVIGGDGKFTREMIEGSTRVNYGQNVDRFHAFGGAVCLAADGASQVRGGNWQIFEQFVKRSEAKVHLNTTVTRVTQLKEDKFVLNFLSSGESKSKSYRAIILAAPYHSSSIALNLLAPDATASSPAYLNIEEVIPPQPYVHLHVTLLSTPSSSARTRYFGLKDGDHVPGMVLTTWDAVRQAELEGKDVPKPEFNSLSYHGKIEQRGSDEPANLTALGLFGAEAEEAHGRDESGEEWSVKIFSDHRLEDSWLRRAFGKLGWVYRKEWDAYPYLTPTTTFPPIQLAGGMYYVNAFEPFVSTMETESISARNIVELLLQQHFNASICKSDEPSNSTASKDDFVYGWDC